MFTCSSLDVYHELFKLFLELCGVNIFAVFEERVFEHFLNAYRSLTEVRRKHAGQEINKFLADWTVFGDVLLH